MCTLLTCSLFFRYLKTLRSAAMVLSLIWLQVCHCGGTEQTPSIKNKYALTHTYIWRGVVCIHQNFTFELFLVAFLHLLLWNFQNIYVRYCVGGGFNPILSPNRKCSLLFGCPQENALAVLVYLKTDVLSNLSLLL